MPEGDTLWKVAEALRPLLVGRVIERAFLRGPTRRPDLEGDRVEAVESLGKHVVLRLASGRHVRTHLGMRGSWHRYRRGSPWQRPAEQASLVLETATHTLVAFHAPVVEVIRGPARWNAALARLGPDLARPEVDFAAVLGGARAIDPATSIAEALLDQRVAAGIGNVFKCEVLFLERTSPFAALAALPDSRLEALYRRAHALLLANLRPGLRATRPLPAAGAKVPARDDLARHWVYGRAGLACFVCDAAVRWTRHGEQARSTWWCPGCQAALG